jgi:hypothetical protein
MSGFIRDVCCSMRPTQPRGVRVYHVWNNMGGMRRERYVGALKTIDSGACCTVDFAGGQEASAGTKQ